MFHRKYGKGVLLLSGICFLIAAVMIGIALFSHSWNGNGDNEEIAVKERQWPATKGAGPQGTYVITRLQGDISESSNNGDEEGENITKESGEITLSDIMVVLDAYNEYIDHAVKNQLWEVDDYGGSGPSAFYGCDVIYVDNEDVPVVFIYDPADNAGGDYIILTYDEGQVHEQILSFYDNENPYSILFPNYVVYSDGENFGPVYKTVYDAYFGKILKFNHILGCFINPLVALDSWEPAKLCSEFMLMSLTYGKDIAKYYPEANMLGNQISISEEDVSNYLMHTIGAADISEWMQYVNQNTNDFQIDIDYIDGEYIITIPWSFFERHWEYYLDPVITDIKLLSDSELQISGLLENCLLENYLELDRTAFLYTYFTVHMALDDESVWNYRLIGIDRWDSYVLPLSDSELWWGRYANYWSTERLELARNEIYARHGIIFENQQVQEYFENCNWYNGTVPEAEFDDSVLNEYESANVKKLTHYISKRES